MSSGYAIELRHITKTFGSQVIANKDVTLSVRKGEILALLGENGSGKTTLMNMIAGIYYPDCGEIIIDEDAIEIRNPRDAFAHGIGMVHQHFKLVDVFTALENIALITDKDEKYDLKSIRKRAQAICEEYAFDLDLDQKVYEMSVSQKQTLEIVKVLIRNVNRLILDEPTAALTPQETEKLFSVMRRRRENGKSIIIITHKLHEVLAISDRVAILRKGEYIDTVDTATATESSLTDMMVGEKVTLDIARDEPVNPTKRLSIHNLSITNPEGIRVLNDVSFDAYGGEILGIAGISGNGQKELLEAIAGLQITEQGASIEYFPAEPEGHTEQLIGKTPREIRNLGVHLSFVPEDRLGMGLVGAMGMTDNMMLKSYNKGATPLADRRSPRQLAEEIKSELKIVTPSVSTPVSRLSGGNVQKVLVGREIAAAPSVLMTAYAVRGLDINTSYTIYNLLCEQKRKGVAIVYVGEDLDVLIDLCDRILVLCGGHCNGIVDARHTTKEEIGLLMTKLKEGAENE
ncbi:MAG: ABC transporter ATP-binding protein [Clostridia bacterium]|nr:ABC transporter ATP-binding protein [Clostridia bacterium]